MILAQEFAVLASSTLIAWLSANCSRLYGSGCFFSTVLCTRPTLSLCVQYLNKHHENSSPVTREFLAKFGDC